MNHDRIMTPYTAGSGRWSDEEKALFDAGLCHWTIEYGSGRGIIYCRRPSKPGASFGHCEAHYAEYLEDFHPDGTPR